MKLASSCTCDWYSALDLSITSRARCSSMGTGSPFSCARISAMPRRTSSLVVVVLERGLDGQRVRAGVLGQGAIDVEGRQVTSEWHAPGADDGVDAESDALLQTVQSLQCHLQQKLGGDHAVVEGRVAPGQEHTLVRQVPAAARTPPLCCRR